MATTQDMLQLKTENFIDAGVPRVMETEPLDSVIKKLQDHPDHTAYVVDAKQRLKGVVSDHDVLEKMTDPNFVQALSTKTAQDVMKPLAPDDKSVARDDEPLINAVSALKTYKSLPVVDEDGTVKGQVTRSSIQRSLDRLL